MNNEKFKEFLAPLFGKAITLLGEGQNIQAMYEQLPEPTIYYVAGVVHGLAIAGPQYKHAWWRDEVRTSAFNLTHEEKRRLLDYVRLRLETRSETS